MDWTIERTDSGAIKLKLGYSSYGTELTRQSALDLAKLLTVLADMTPAAEVVTLAEAA